MIWSPVEAGSVEQLERFLNPDVWPNAAVEYTTTSAQEVVEKEPCVVVAPETLCRVKIVQLYAAGALRGFHCHARLQAVVDLVQQYRCTAQAALEADHFGVRLALAYECFAGELPWPIPLRTSRLRSSIEMLPEMTTAEEFWSLFRDLEQEARDGWIYKRVVAEKLLHE